MNKTELKDLISSLVSDITFTYQHREGSICPFAADNIVISYGANVLECKSVNEVMAVKFFNGKSMDEISNQISFD